MEIEMQRVVRLLCDPSQLLKFPYCSAFQPVFLSLKEYRSIELLLCDLLTRE